MTQRKSDSVVELMNRLIKNDHSDSSNQDPKPEKESKEEIIQKDQIHKLNESDLSLFENKTKVSDEKNQEDEPEDLLEDKPEDGLEDPPAPPPQDQNPDKNEDHFKLAEKRIEELEEENKNLQEENKKLASSSAQFESELQELKQKYQNVKEDLGKEHSGLYKDYQILKNIVENHKEKINRLQEENIRLEEEIEYDTKQVHVQERELENRLELKQKEMEAIIAEKDSYLLQLKEELSQVRTQFDRQKNIQQKQNKAEVSIKNRAKQAIEALQECERLLQDDSNLSSVKDLLEERREREEEIVAENEFKENKKLEKKSDKATMKKTA